MAIFSTSRGVDMNGMNLFLDTSFFDSYWAEPTRYSVEIGNADEGSEDAYGGTGFTYTEPEEFSAEMPRLVGGTVTGISWRSWFHDYNDEVEGDQVYLESGVWVDGLSIDVVNLNQFQEAGDAKGFREFVFGWSDIITGSEMGDLLNGFDGDDTIWGRAGDDSVAGGAGGDTLDGGRGADTLEGGAAADFLSGGGGVDLLSYRASGMAVKVSLADGSASGGDAEGDTISGFRNLLGSAHADVLKGDGNANALTGGSGGDRLFGDLGADWLEGGNGHDRLEGGAGSDEMFGGAGNDIYVVNSAGDRVAETTLPTGSIDAGGFDRVVASASVTLALFVEELELTGGANLNGTGQAGANRIFGNGGANTLRGLDGADSLYGGGGNDRLDGGAGGDRMESGSGDDRYVVSHGQDNLVEGFGQGVDTVEAWISETLLNNLDQLELRGAAANGTGNGLRNRLTGNDAGNTLSGLGEMDVLSGRGGVDILLGGEMRDTLDGGEGRDSLAGGLGNDVFLFHARSEADGDVLRDFRNASGDNDAIHIRVAGFGAGLSATGGAVTTAQFESEAGDNVAEGEGTRFVFNRANGQLWFDSNGSDSGGLTLLADLATGTLIGRDDILLV